MKYRHQTAALIASWRSSIHFYFTESVKAAPEPAAKYCTSVRSLYWSQSKILNDQITDRRRKDKSIWPPDWQRQQAHSLPEKLPHSAPEGSLPHIPPFPLPSGSAHLVIGGRGRLVLIGCRQREVERVDSRLPHLGLLWDLHQHGGGHLHLGTCGENTHTHCITHTKWTHSWWELIFCRRLVLTSIIGSCDVLEESPEGHGCTHAHEVGLGICWHPASWAVVSHLNTHTHAHTRDTWQSRTVWEGSPWCVR